MFHPKKSQLLLVLVFLSITISSIPTTISSPLSTIAIAATNDFTLVCALIPPANPAAAKYTLNCTTLPDGTQRYYSAGASSYSAVAGGDGYLCAIGSTPSGAIMRWWDLENRQESYSWTPDYKRVYVGPPIVKLSASDTHVCAIKQGSTHLPYCWRWPELSIPAGLNFSDIAVGGNFLCGLLSDGGKLRCFGDDPDVVGKEPAGSHVMIAAGTRHACAVSADEKLVCWGAGAPLVDAEPFAVSALALGENTTCALGFDGIVQCWGGRCELPEKLAKKEFVAIQAHGSAICGVLSATFSLVCWGNDIFLDSSIVYENVLPGTCATSCPCRILADTGNICPNGTSVCLACPPKRISISPPPPPTPAFHNSTSHPPPSTGNRRIIYISVGSAVFAVLLMFLMCFIVGHLRRSGRPSSPTVAPSPTTRQPLSFMNSNQKVYVIEEFPLSVLLDVTETFSESHKIGSGSFGSVYRATLRDGRVVAIKRAESSGSASTSRAAARHRETDKESAFLSELALLSRVNHKNLVQLIGYCRQGTERVIVYEFMANGTLHDHLHMLQGSAFASWGARLRAALDAARGLEYLHVYAVPPIIHRDIKSSNILLDDTWTAKVSDFGLSLMSPPNEPKPESDGSESMSGLVRAAGTVGYMDPEYYRLRRLTSKSDVYSFGVVLLELLTGCKAVQQFMDSCTPMSLVEYVVPPNIEDNVQLVLDPQLPPPAPWEAEALMYLGNLAADCVNPNGEDRPTMTEVVNELEQAVSRCDAPLSEDVIIL